MNISTKHLYIILIYILFIIMSCKSETYSRGKMVYTNLCENCHMADGTGLPPLYPSLVNSVYVDYNLSMLTCLIQNGKQSNIISNIAMPAHDLSDIDMANLINYLNDKWGSKKPLSINEVKENMARCANL
ncbi:MAG: cytochrome c [Saprospiraceae bacterium]